MSVLSTLALVATILSGLVSLGLIAAAGLDAVTRGWVRDKARSWLGIEGLRTDHHDTQTFLLDLGEAHNRLSEKVCEEHDIEPDEAPPTVSTDYYTRRLEGEEGVGRGDFLSEYD